MELLEKLPLRWAAQLLLLHGLRHIWPMPYKDNIPLTRLVVAFRHIPSDPLATLSKLSPAILPTAYMATSMQSLLQHRAWQLSALHPEK
jgi:hypothetical protein